MAQEPPWTVSGIISLPEAFLPVLIRIWGDLPPILALHLPTVFLAGRAGRLLGER